MSPRTLRQGTDASERGQAVVWAVFGLLILLLVGAGVLDVYHLEATRASLYQVAAEASLVGVSRGRDWGRFTSTGEWALDGATAHAEALASAQTALARRGITPSELQVVVLPEPAGGVVAGFPPVPRARLDGVADWTETEPAVGVYIAADVPTVFFGWVNGSDRVTVHAFSAAGLATVQP